MKVNPIIHVALARCGGSQAELGRLLQKNKRIISCWVNGKTAPSLASLVQLGALAGVGAETIVSGYLKRPKRGAAKRAVAGPKKVSRTKRAPRATAERPGIPPGLAALSWFSAAWAERMNAAKENGKKIGPTGERLQLQRLEKALRDPEYGEVAVKSLVEDATAAGWQGIKLDWYRPKERRSRLPASMERHRAFLGAVADETDVDERARRATRG